MAMETAAVGRSGKLPWQLPRTFAEFRGICRASDDFRGNGRGRPWMAGEVAVVGRPQKLPWQLPRTSADFRGDCRVAVAMAADGRRNCHGSFGGNHGWYDEVATDRTAARAVPWPQPWHLPWKCHEPWHLPWKPADFYGSPRQHSRNSTEIQRSLPANLRPKVKQRASVHSPLASFYTNIISLLTFFHVCCPLCLHC